MPALYVPLENTVRERARPKAQIAMPDRIAIEDQVTKQEAVLIAAVAITALQERLSR